MHNNIRKYQIRFPNACKENLVPRPLPSVVLPMEQLLVLDKFRTLTIGDFSPEMLILQQLQEVQAHGILDEFRIFRLAPVLKVIQVIAEGPFLEEATLGQEIQIVRIGEALDEFEFDLKPYFLLILGVVHRC